MQRATPSSQRSEPAKGELGNLLGWYKRNCPWDGGWEEHTCGSLMRMYKFSPDKETVEETLKCTGRRKKEGEAPESGHKDGVGKSSWAVHTAKVKSTENIWKAGCNHRGRLTISARGRINYEVRPWLHDIGQFELIFLFLTYQHLGLVTFGYF